MLFLNSLDKLVKNLSDEDFKYLSEEYSGEHFKTSERKRNLPLRIYGQF